MKTLAEYKRYMRDYAKTNVDLEEGETPRDWLNAMLDALEEEGSIVTINGKKYVKD